MRRLTVGVLVMTVLGTTVGLALAIAGALQGPIHPPTAAALQEIPPAFRDLYVDATTSRCPALPWSVLAGLGRVESMHGTSGGAWLRDDGDVAPWIVGPALDGSDGVRLIVDSDGGEWDGDAVYDRAVGPMQFLPSTWRTVGIDASGDRTASPHTAADAVHSAAIYLCENGAASAQGLRAALFAYNRSTDYVDEVLYHAVRYGWAAGFQPAEPGIIEAVLANPRLTIYSAGRDDIASGLIDGRVLALLQQLSTRYTLTISSLKTGHSRCVGGGERRDCRVSHHWYGRGVDIAAVNGREVTTSNTDAYAIVDELARGSGVLRPDQIGSPWPEFDPLPGAFSDSAHLDHLHLSFGPNTR